MTALTSPTVSRLIAHARLRALAWLLLALLAFVVLSLGLRVLQAGQVAEATLNVRLGLLIALRGVRS